MHNYIHGSTIYNSQNINNPVISEWIKNLGNSSIKTEQQVGYLFCMWTTPWYRQCLFPTKKSFKEWFLAKLRVSPNSIGCGHKTHTKEVVKYIGREYPTDIRIKDNQNIIFCYNLDRTRGYYEKINKLEL